MSESTVQQSAGISERPGFGQTVAPSSIASLAPFPPMLQEAIVNAVLGANCEKATDIWYEDEATKCVLVMRHGVHWQLNQTASALWLRLGKRGGEIADELCQEYPGTDPQEIRFLTVEFLLNATSNGLVELNAEPGRKKTKPARS
jgi:hypothetical protein